MIGTSATATMTGQVPLRPALSLTTGEGLLAFVAGAGVWFVLNQVPSYHVTLPAWSSFILCNVLAASTVAGWRSIRSIKTHSLSRFGYATLALPALESALAVLIAVSIVNKLDGFLTLFALLLMGCFFAHVVGSAHISVFGFAKGDHRGDKAALPLFVVWCVLLGVLMVSVDAAPRDRKDRGATSKTNVKITADAGRR